MRIAAAILTYNMHQTGREGLFATTYNSLSADPPDVLTVVTCGSTDGTQEDIRRLGGIVSGPRHHIWYGMRVAIDWCLQQKPDIVLFSNDDILYAPDWRPRLESLWTAAPENLKLVSLILEPEWPWNAVYDARTLGSERVLLRENAPGAAWSFRARDAPIIGRIPRRAIGADSMVSDQLRKDGYDLGQLELAEHLGEAFSVWGNPCWKSAQPLDRARWGLPPEMPDWFVTPIPPE